MVLKEFLQHAKLGPSDQHFNWVHLPETKFASSFFSEFCIVPGIQKLAFLNESYEISMFICMFMYVYVCLL